MSNEEIMGLAQEYCLHIDFHQGMVYKPQREPEKSWCWTTMENGVYSAILTCVAKVKKMEEELLNIDAATSSLNTIRKMHEVGAATIEDVERAEELLRKISGKEVF